MSRDLSDFIDEWGFFTPIPELVIGRIAAIGVDAFALFAYLRYRTHKDRHVAWPGYEDIEKMTGLRRERIAAGLRALEGAGLLERTKRFGSTTVYRLVRPPDVPPFESSSPPVGLLEDVATPSVVRQADPSSPAGGLQLSAPRTPVPRQVDGIQDVMIQESLNQEGMNQEVSPSSNGKIPCPRCGVPILPERVDVPCSGHGAPSADLVRMSHRAVGGR